jgi:integrase
MSVYRYREKWRADAGFINGKRITRVFDTIRDAELWLNARLTEKQKIKMRIGILDPKLSLDAEAAAALLKGRCTLEECARFWADRHVELSKSCYEAVEYFLADLSRRNCRPRYIDGMRSTLGSFVNRMGSDRLISECTTSEIRDWLDQWTPKTMVHRRREVIVFLNWCVQSEIIPENVALKISAPRLDRQPISVLTPQQAKAILSGTTDGTRAYFAISMFAGLRSAEIQRLRWGDVQLERGFIEVGVDQAKSRSRRLVKIEPNLLAWLQPVIGSKADSISRSNHSDLTGRACSAAKMRTWPNNVCRHSFGSYHLAHFRDINETALQMGHTTTAMLFRHYREVVSPEDAATYWDIWPEDIALANER